MNEFAALLLIGMFVAVLLLETGIVSPEWSDHSLLMRVALITFATAAIWFFTALMAFLIALGWVVAIITPSRRRGMHRPVDRCQLASAAR